jgi:sortase A
MNMGDRVTRIVGTAVAWLGLVVLLYVGVVLAQTRQAAAAPLRPIAAGQPLVVGQPLGQIRIERLGLEAAITEGERGSILKRGVGHLSDTPWIGQGGNVALAGHRDTVFRSLRKIRPGDVIEITTADKAVRYSVDRTTVVQPDDLSVLKPLGRSTLTLITCYPFSYFGSAPDRFIVHATEIDSQHP